MVNDDATVMFKYDHNGLRTEKYVKLNGTETTTKYIYSGTRLVHMTQGSNWLHFFYDGQGQPAEMNFNGTVYIYVKNLQGDIVGIVDTTGRIVVEYKYDAWGRPTYSNSLVDSNSTLTARYALMLTLNPIRYRGYVYDDEINLYYLRSRYYKPDWGRFVNTDVMLAAGLLMVNSFIYCANDPIRRTDSNGMNWFLDGLKKVGNYILECLHAQGKQDVITTQQNIDAVNTVYNGAKEVVKTIGGGLKKGLQAQVETDIIAAEITNNVVSDLIDGAKSILSKLGNALKNTLQVQQKVNILSKQMTYNTAWKIGNWIFPNIEDWINKFSISYSIVGTLVEAGAFLGFYTIPVAGQAFMIATSLAFGIYAFIQEAH